MRRVTLGKERASGLIIYIIQYFIFLYVALLTLELMLLIPAVLHFASLRYLIIGVALFILFFSSNVVVLRKMKHKISPIKIVSESLIDVTFIVPIIQILTNKRPYKRTMNPNGIFLLGIGYFFIIFLTSLAFYEVIFHVPHLVTVLAGTGELKTTGSSSYLYPGFIIIHNSIFLAEIVLGSFFLLIPTFGAILSDILITTPILISLINNGYSNTIMPQFLLEFVGTALASGSAVLIFYMFFTSMLTRVKTYEYMRMMVYSKQILIVGISLSIYAFLLGWPIETELLLSNVHPQIWYNSIYLFDAATIIIYIAFLYDITVNSVFPLQRIILPSLWSGILLFITLAGNGKYVPEMILDIFLLGAFSLIYPIFSFFRSFMKRNKNIKKMTELFNIESCLITGVRGISMKPVISQRDYVITYKTDDHFSFNVGDVVTYEPPLAFAPLSDTRYVTHRIVKIEGDRIITRGDNVKREDPPIRPFRIYGLAIATYDHELGIFSVLTNREEMKETTLRVKRIAIRESNSISNMNKVNGKFLYYTLISSLAISLALPAFFLFVL